VLGVDLIGTWNCIRHEIAAFRAHGGGNIVNNASNAGLTGVPNMAPYAAAKAGVINLTMMVVIEHGPENIRCNAIAPGTIETPPVHRTKAEGFDFTIMAERAPLRRLGRPEEAGELVALAARSSPVMAKKKGRPKAPPDHSVIARLRNRSERRPIRRDGSDPCGTRPGNRRRSTRSG